MVGFATAPVWLWLAALVQLHVTVGWPLGPPEPRTGPTWAELAERTRPRVEGVPKARLDEVHQAAKLSNPQAILDAARRVRALRDGGTRPLDFVYADAIADRLRATLAVSAGLGVDAAEVRALITPTPADDQRRTAVELTLILADLDQLTPGGRSRIGARWVEQAHQRTRTLAGRALVEEVARLEAEARAGPHAPLWIVTAGLAMRFEQGLLAPSDRPP